jgi:hypothetical protein
MILSLTDTKETSLYYFRKKSYASPFYSRGKVTPLAETELAESRSCKEFIDVRIFFQ